MKDIFNFDCRDAIRGIVRKILKDDYGIKIPKEKASKVQVNMSVCKMQKIMLLGLKIEGLKLAVSAPACIPRNDVINRRAS